MSNKIVNDIKKEFNEALNIKTKIWNELYTEWPIVKEIEFSELNFLELLEKKEMLHLKYYDQLVNEQTKGQILEDKLDEVIGDRYDFYRFDYDKSLSPQEIKNYYLNRDSEVLNIKRMILYQKFKTEFFKMCVDNIYRLGFTVKEYADMIKKGI